MKFELEEPIQDKWRILTLKNIVEEYNGNINIIIYDLDYVIPIYTIYINNGKQWRTIKNFDKEEHLKLIEQLSELKKTLSIEYQTRIEYRRYAVLYKNFKPENIILSYGQQLKKEFDNYKTKTLQDFSCNLYNIKVFVDKHHGCDLYESYLKLTTMDIISFMNHEEYKHFKDVLITPWNRDRIFRNLRGVDMVDWNEIETWIEGSFDDGYKTDVKNLDKKIFNYFDSIVAGKTLLEQRTILHYIMMKIFGYNVDNETFDNNMELLEARKLVLEDINKTLTNYRYNS